VFRLFLSLAIVALPLAGVPARGAPQDAAAKPYRDLHTVDRRLAIVADRLTTANAALCRELQPATGMVLHAVDQYSADAPGVRAAFAFPAPVAVEAVVPGGPAATAGILPDDGVVAIAGQTLAAPAPGGAISSATRDAAQALLAARPPAAPLSLQLRRGAALSTVTIHPRPGCRVAFEVLTGNLIGASSDGRVVQLGSRLFELFDDDQIAVVAAHELAHAILRHRARLEAAGVTWGLLAEFGRNGRLFRTTETEADLLGAYLLRNAGYDPRSAVRFWREQGGKVDGGAFRSRTHPSSKARAAAIEAELATMPPDAPIPYAPPLLERRDAPLR
jgi:hypothetical protein